MGELKYDEQALQFDCEGDELIGVLSLPRGTPAGDVGLLIVVGGPQYRVGSHRLFVRLARQAATEGVPALRFDYRGMGDSQGEMRTFEHIEADVRAAVDAFLAAAPAVKRVVLWGLCDGASASCLYAPQDPRVVGLALVNPWVRTPEGAAVTSLRHYYLQRLVSPALWQKIFSGRIPSLKPLLGLVTQVVRNRVARLLKSGEAPHGTSAAALPLPARLGHALVQSGVPVAVALSDDDKVAREFEDQAMPTPLWRQMLDRQTLTVTPLTPADHTVSIPETRERLCVQSIAWVRELAAQARRA